jgi:hypothetical protein
MVVTNKLSEGICISFKKQNFVRYYFSIGYVILLKYVI